MTPIDKLSPTLSTGTVLIHEDLRSDARSEDRLTNLLYAAAIIGVVARMVQYVWRRSYWHDEAYLVLNVTSLTHRQLVGPLPNAQSAPPLFLLAQKALFDTFGSSELVLRFVPMVLACGAVVLMSVLARRFLGPIGAVCAVAMFALSDRLIAHAAEAKQYSGDVFFALLLLLAATDPNRSNVRRLLGASLVTAAALWCSHPTVFVFGGIALTLLPSFLKRGWMTGASAFTACCVPALLSFAALYVVSIRHQEVGSLYAYWIEDFPDWSRPWLLPLWLAKRPIELARYVYEYGGELVCALAVLGAWSLWRGGRRKSFGILLAPAALALLASLVHRYPFGGSRLTLFLAPAVFALAGEGIERLWHSVAANRWRGVGIAVPVIVFGIGVTLVAYHLIVPRHRGHIRPAVEFVRTHREPGEPVYMVGEDEPFLCYWREPGVPIRTSETAATNLADDQFWLVFTMANRRDARVRGAMVDRMRKRVDLTLRHALAQPGGAAYHFERVTKAATSPACPATQP